MNVVMTGSGRFVEVQGTGEEATFSEQELAAMLDLARGGIADLTALQRKRSGGPGPGRVRFFSRERTHRSQKIPTSVLRKTRRGSDRPWLDFECPP